MCNKQIEERHMDTKENYIQTHLRPWSIFVIHFCPLSDVGAARCCAAFNGVDGNENDTLLIGQR